MLKAFLSDEQQQINLNIYCRVKKSRTYRGRTIARDRSRHFLGAQNRRALAGFTQGISQPQHLLAALALLGKTRRLAQSLASFSWRTEPAPELDWSESFLDGSFAPAKKGASASAKPSASKARSGWWWFTARVFLWESNWAAPARRSKTCRKRSGPNFRAAKTGQTAGPSVAGTSPIVALRQRSVELEIAATGHSPDLSAPARAYANSRSTTDEFAPLPQPLENRAHLQLGCPATNDVKLSQ